MVELPGQVTPEQTGAGIRALIVNERRAFPPLEVFPGLLVEEGGEMVIRPKLRLRVVEKVYDGTGTFQLRGQPAFPKIVVDPVQNRRSPPLPGFQKIPGQYGGHDAVKARRVEVEVRLNSHEGRTYRFNNRPAFPSRLDQSLLEYPI